MPLQYEGTIAEHTAVRTGTGVFDVSHLGRFRVSGPGAFDLVDALLCNDLRRIEPGRAQYTMMLTPDGGVIDDIIVWWLADDDYVVLPNGANHDDVLLGFTDAAPGDTVVADLRPETALFAVQGPDSAGVLDDVLGAHPARFRVLELPDGDSPVTIAGTGYTGERGAEVMVGGDAAADLFDRLVAAGAAPCGLGARDTLRLEMGYALWGQDLDRTTSPLEAGLGWVVGWGREFTGSLALEGQRDGVEKRLIGFAMEGRRIPRHGYAVRCGGSTGTVTSGGFGPSVDKAIGLGYVSPDPGDADTVEVEIRGTWESAHRIDPPFLER